MNDGLARRVVMAGFQGTALPDDVGELLNAGLAGVILFKRNIASVDGVRVLTSAIQHAAEGKTIIAIDQEGGRVARLGEPVLQLPPMRQLGDRNDAEYTFECGKTLGSQLSELGITLNFAPVLDVDTNPANPVIGDRSFSSNADVVAKHGRAFSKGLLAGGVWSCGKHFPGHGDTNEDSHFALPSVVHSLQRMRDVELYPFVQNLDMPSFMTAHVVFSALDSTCPATLSRKVMTDLVRNELGYRGVLISDDLEMKAISERYGVGEAAVMAVRAGCDLLLVCSQVDLARQACDALATEARASAEFRARLEEAASRVEKLRERPARS